MLDETPIKVGDELVEYGKVYKVFAIEDKKTYDGKVEKHIFFKPIYETVETRTLSCAIPLKNISQANIRRPLLKKKMNEVFEILSAETDFDLELADVTAAKEVLKLNSPHESAKVLRIMWNELNDEELNSTKSRKDMFELSLKTLSQEVAFAFDITLEKAEKKLQNALRKAIN